MSLRRIVPARFERSRDVAVLRPWLPAAQEATVMLSLAGGVCLSWPQVVRAMLLASKIALYYCLSPR